MARKVFISFRYEDGIKYKEELSELFDEETTIINCSENEDRSNLSEESIKKYLYSKLKTTSVTVIIITPEAVSHKTNWLGKYDDWMYDEIRYSLEDRENNRSNGIVAVYVPEAKELLMKENTHKCKICNKEQKILSILDVDNLFRKNMMNVKPEYKTSPCMGVYDSLNDSYCSLISWEEFKLNYKKYIEQAAEKRDLLDRYNIIKRM